jgi:autotransporter translocation and assembly factor TamB
MGAESTRSGAIELRQGRTLTIDSAGDDGLVEIRGPSGALELRIRTTEQGPVLELETLRLSLRAAESIDIDCDEFNVSAARSVGLSSNGEISLSGNADVRVDANGDVHVTGEMIYLN